MYINAYAYKWKGVVGSETKIIVIRKLTSKPEDSFVR